MMQDQCHKYEHMNNDEVCLNIKKVDKMCSISNKLFTLMRSINFSNYFISKHFRNGNPKNPNILND